MKMYKEYYDLAKKTYANSSPKVDLYSFTHEIIIPGSSGKIIEHIPDNYISLVKKIAKICDNKLSDDDQCYWPHGPDSISKNNDLVRMCKDYFDITELETLAAILIPQIEKNLFGCNVQLQNLYIYRNNITKEPPRASWLWHYDNHPYQYNKCMIYLTDVDEGSAPLEFMEHTETKELFKYKPTRTGYRQWIAAPNNSRLTKNQLEELKKRGFKPKKICGPSGTIIIFNENSIHRATVATKNHRDVLTFLLKPSIEKLAPYVNKNHTGGFQNKDMFKDPSHRKLIFK
jgi:hypothetical protein